MEACKIKWDDNKKMGVILLSLAGIHILKHLHAQSSKLNHYI